MAAPGRKISNYSGWLLKIGEYQFPAKYIAANTYQAYDNMQDVNPWVDENGYTHRDAVELKAIKVEFETPAMLTDDDLSEIISNIQHNIVNRNENGCYITAYIPRLNDYVTQYGYMADFQPQIYGTYGGVIHYNPIRFAFIGGVYND